MGTNEVSSTSNLGGILGALTEIQESQKNQKSRKSHESHESHESQSSSMDTDPFDSTAPFIPLGDWQLSPAQLAASEAGIRHLLRRDRDSSYKPFLIWAVTGAGKTEMIFPLVATELQRGGKVLIATPRRDVVLELLPRIKTAFPHQQVIALYGGSTQRWELGDITIATTHQLLRYEGAFDLVVIDEIDAYPYHNNPVLEYAAQKVRSHRGAVVLLSATPPAHLQVDARKGRIAHVKVPVRYHGKPLPTPRILRYGGIHKLHTAAEKKSPILSEGESLDTAAPDVKSKLLHWLPSRDGSGQLAAIIAESLERGAQLFIFVPAIHRLEPTLAWVRSRTDKLCNRTQIEATSSQDEHRHDKILRFRAASTRILLTTTILERGVTIPKADVIVLDADSALFDAAALVQMAGRAGRSATDPFGKVHFLSREHTRAQTEAISQIRGMNQLARRRGYISKGTELWVETTATERIFRFTSNFESHLTATERIFRLTSNFESHLTATERIFRLTSNFENHLITTERIFRLTSNLRGVPHVQIVNI
jgi:competence protein ComFA